MTDLSKLSDSDLKAIVSGDVRMMSDAGLRLIAGQHVDAPQFGKKLDNEIQSVPRQLGLTARAGLQGVGDTLEFLSSPIRAGMNALGADIQPGVGKRISDAIGLPTPSTTTEKVVGKGAEFLAPGGMFIKAGRAMSNMGGDKVREFGNILASNPMSQLQSAAGAGTLGEYAKETGGGDGAQLVASIAGGLSAPAASSIVSRAPSAMANLARRGAESIGLSRPDVASVNVTINNLLKDSGITLADLPSQVANSIRADVGEALKTGASLDANAVRRLADYRLVGATPRAANLTLDPVALTQQKNLAKIGANSKDPAAQLLARAENANNQVLISRLNELGANSTQDAVGAGQTIINALNAKNQGAKSVINNLYSKARATDGRSANLDHVAFTNTANNLLDEAMLGGRLPGDVRNALNRVASGEMPLTVDVAEQIKTRLGDLSRSTTDLAERKSLGLVRDALEQTPLLESQGQQAIDAFNKARRVNKAWMDVVDRTPALQAVRDGIEPDKFVNQFIIGSGDGASVMSVSHLKQLTKSNPEAMDAIRGQIAQWLKTNALNQATDEVGKFSQSAFNRSLQKIGDRKLNLFFSPEEVKQLKAVGRVASYEQVQPVGSAVNNSNTAPLMSAIIDRLGRSPLLSKIPFGSELVGQPAQNIAVGLQSRRAIDVPSALQLPQMRRPLVPAVSPAMGLLGFGPE